MFVLELFGKPSTCMTLRHVCIISVEAFRKFLGIRNWIFCGSEFSMVLNVLRTCRIISENCHSRFLFPYMPTNDQQMSWMKVFRIIPEFRNLKGNLPRKVNIKAEY